mgnify:CR=1 FL=1
MWLWKRRHDPAAFPAVHARRIPAGGRRISFDFMNPFPGGEAVRPEDQADRIMPERFQILRIDAGLHDQDGDRFLYAEPPQGIG